MDNSRTILFPTDFSPRAGKALDEAIDFGGKFNDELIIYHVYHRPIIDGGTREELASALKKVDKRIDHEFEELKKNHKKLNNVKYVFKKELGISTNNILKFASKEKVDLIIMATKGANGFGQLWGTKTAEIVKKSEIPVIVMPDNTSLSSIKKVGLACDYSEKTDYKTLDFLLDVAESLQLDVDVISMNTNEKLMDHEGRSYRDLIQNRLKDVKTSFNFTFSENIEDGVIDYCKENEIGLISILPKSYNFIEKLFHESLTERMTFHSPIPLLVLK